MGEFLYIKRDFQRTEMKHYAVEGALCQFSNRMQESKMERDNLKFKNWLQLCFLKQTLARYTRTGWNTCHISLALLALLKLTVLWNATPVYQSLGLYIRPTDDRKLTREGH